MATKRKQVKNACVNCQKACKKCDEGRPCQRCIKYGLEASCRDSERKERALRRPEQAVDRDPFGFAFRTALPPIKLLAAIGSYLFLKEVEEDEDVVVLKEDTGGNQQHIIAAPQPSLISRLQPDEHDRYRSLHTPSPLPRIMTPPPSQEKRSSSKSSMDSESVAESESQMIISESTITISSI